MDSPLEDFPVILPQFDSNFFYGDYIDIALPTKIEDQFSPLALVSEGSAFTPVPYAVARYSYVCKVDTPGEDENTTSFVYQFEGVYIIQNK